MLRSSAGSFFRLDLNKNFGAADADRIAETLNAYIDAFGRCRIVVEAHQ